MKYKKKEIVDIYNFLHTFTNNKDFVFRFLLNITSVLAIRKWIIKILFCRVAKVLIHIFGDINVIKTNVFSLVYIHTAITNETAVELYKKGFTEYSIENFGSKNKN